MKEYTVIVSYRIETHFYVDAENPEEAVQYGYDIKNEISHHESDVTERLIETYRVERVIDSETIEQVYPMNKKEQR